jgi:single-stranded-DNA-specific exonuclease
MLNEKIWVYNGIDEKDIDKLANETGVSRLIAKVLLNRNIKDGDYIKSFLNPDLKNLHNPFLMKDMEKAVERIISSIDVGEKITLYGDYDVDGVTGTTILYDFLKYVGADVTFYIPDRLEEGYGVSKDAVEFLINQDSDLIITIDCGITAIHEAAYAKENNVDMIITDHHECGETLPGAFAVINPCRPDCEYPFSELAGVGVVFKLINALCIKMGLNDMYLKYLDLVAIGTVADIVTLRDENRVIVKYGMEIIPETTNIGLKALLNISGLEGKTVGPYEIGFIIGPRINAAGRTGDAIKAVDMFITKDENKALDIAKELDEANRLRQEIEHTIYQQAIEKVEAEIDLKKEKVIVLAKEGWHQGVIGIVASRIIENYYRPCILISIDGDVGKGSGRSIDGFNLFEALKNCESLLEKYGGHELAAGLTIDSQKINDFRLAINKYANSVMEEDILIPKIKIDAYIDKDDLSLENVGQLDLLSPFGPGNPSPVFGCKGLIVDEIRGVGADFKHLKSKLYFQGLPIDAIGFNMGSMIDSLKKNDNLDVAARLELNTWNSITKVQLNLRDIRLNKNIREYYYSLDKCLDLDCKNWEENIEKYNSLNGEVCKYWKWIKNRKTLRNGEAIDGEKLIEDEKSLIKTFLRLLDNNKKIAIFVNSMDMVMKFEKILEKFSGSIKKSCHICYTSYGNCNAELTMVVNPIPESIDYMSFDVGIIAGEWISINCLLGILNRIVDAQREIIFYTEQREYTRGIEEIVPERDDLAALYRYIRANCQNDLLIEDLFIFASEISKVYNVSMGYVKAKKGLEIFHELGLMEVISSDLYSITIKYNPDKIKCVNLEDSLIFTNLQRLKDTKEKL